MSSLRDLFIFQLYSYKYLAPTVLRERKGLVLFESLNVINGIIRALNNIFHLIVFAGFQLKTCWNDRIIFYKKEHPFKL